VPIAPGLVDMLVTIKPMQATDDDFVFSAIGTAPIAYWNFRDRGFVPALTKAGRRARGSRSTASAPQRFPCMRLAASQCWRRRRSWASRTPASPGSTTPALFDRSDVEARVRAAQASLGAP
jgi:hypothetical protein